jgi:hypothetical protein
MSSGSICWRGRSRGIGMSSTVASYRASSSWGRIRTVIVVPETTEGQGLSPLAFLVSSYLADLHVDSGGPVRRVTRDDLDLEAVNEVVFPIQPYGLLGMGEGVNLIRMAVDSET